MKINKVKHITSILLILIIYSIHSQVLFSIDNQYTTDKEITISKILVNNIPVEIVNDTILLDYKKQNDFTIFWEVNKNNTHGISFQLVPFDKNWIYYNEKKYSTRYTNLPQGEYAFKLKLNENEIITLQHVIIKPKIWQKLWFKTALICLKITIIVFLI